MNKKRIATRKKMKNANRKSYQVLKRKVKLNSRNRLEDMPHDEAEFLEFLLVNNLIIYIDTILKNDYEFNNYV